MNRGKRLFKIADTRSWNKNAYEFEMLYGVRDKYQKKLVRDGKQLRLYLPFGKDWWLYAIRRISESPKNIKFLFRSLFFSG